MNQKIKELAAQAYSESRELFDGAHPVVNTDKWNQKFAELIINECCGIFLELRTRPADLAVNDVKNHFGLEQ